MLSFAFASIVAAALLLAFRETRALGAVAVFVIASLDPRLLLPLLALTGGGYLVARRLAGRGPPQGR